MNGSLIIRELLSIKGIILLGIFLVLVETYTDFFYFDRIDKKIASLKSLYEIPSNNVDVKNDIEKELEVLAYDVISYDPAITASSEWTKKLPTSREEFTDIAQHLSNIYDSIRNNRSIKFIRYSVEVSDSELLNRNIALKSLNDSLQMKVFENELIAQKNDEARAFYLNVIWVVVLITISLLGGFTLLYHFNLLELRVGKFELKKTPKGSVDNPSAD